MSQPYRPQIWEYQDRDPADLQPFGDETTYKVGLGWLFEECDYVEDWGAGVAYGRRFCPEGKTYFAVDGSPTSEPYVDKVSHLLAHQPDRLVEGIYMRHILEHNPEEWKRILDKALITFTKRFCLVMFTPFAVGERRQLRPHGDPYYDVSFTIDDIRDCLDGYRWYLNAMPTNTQYGGETIFFVEH